MNINKFLYQRSTFYFALFFGFALIAFWPNYFSKVGESVNPRFHTHGIPMTLWCLMLIAQPYLIRTKKRKLHRYIGWFSYALVPIIVVSTLNLVHFRASKKEVLTEAGLADMALMLNSTLVFVIIYALAIYYKKDSLTHARYMVATVFPMFTPITDRIIYMKIPFMVEWMPVIAGKPMVPVAGFLLADILLISLLLWDWRSNKRWKAFGISLALLLAYQTSVLTFHLIPFWRSIGEWFLSLPLS